MRPPPAPPGPAGVYLHFPFCTRRCGYCDFPTVAGRDDRIVEYLRALELEIRTFQRELPREVDSVYFGGGTPSRMTPRQVARLLRAVRRRFALAPCTEVTLEANPESLDRAKLRDYAAAGVNRISVGVQSLDDRALARAGRCHCAAVALRAVEAAQTVAGLSVSVDLIAGLPGESLDAWEGRLRRVAASPLDHLSLYLLESDKQTPLARALRAGRVAGFDDDTLAELYERSVELLREVGLEQYEISNFARRGRACAHNLKYWTDGWYGGFGLGAHGYAAGRRRANHRELGRYLRALAVGRDPVEREEAWHPRRRLEEAMILGLRRVAGLDLRRLGRRYAADLEGALRGLWDRAVDEGLLEREGPVVRLTRRGRLQSNLLFAELLEAPAA